MWVLLSDGDSYEYSYSMEIMSLRYDDDDDYDEEGWRIVRGIVTEVSEMWQSGTVHL